MTPFFKRVEVNLPENATPDVTYHQTKGERNYFEFDLDKSKNFHTTGLVEISLRKATRKQQYADLKLVVDDRELSKKSLDLYEPVTFRLEPGYSNGETALSCSFNASTRK